VTTVRQFDGTVGDEILCNVGALADMAYGTIAVLFKTGTGAGAGVDRALMHLHDSSGFFAGGLYVNADGDLVWRASSSSVAAVGLADGDWTLLVVRKASGTTAPRFSVWDEATDTWTHPDGDTAIADWFGAEGGTIRFSFQGLADFFDGAVAARAAWANRLPWTADAAGDADIEAAGLTTNLDNWRDADPDASWGFGQPTVVYNVEDLSAGQADEIDRVGTTVVEDTSLSFQYEGGGLLTTSRNHLRSTQDEPGSSGTLFDLSETQGTPGTVGLSTSSGGFVVVREWHREVGATVGSASIPTSLRVTAVSASTLRYRWRVDQYDSSGVLKASSNYSTEHNTTGIKTETLTLTTTWAAGDRLRFRLEERKASGGGSRTVTVGHNDPDSWAEFEVATVTDATATPATVAVTASVPAPAAQAGAAPTPATVAVVSAAGAVVVQAGAAATPATVAVAAAIPAVVAPTQTGLISGTVSANPVTLSCGVGERLICIAFSRGGGTTFSVTPNAGGASWINRVAEATLPANDLARRSLGVAELVPTSGITDGLFTAAWSADSTDAIWLRVQEGGAFGFAAAATADSDTGSVTSLATGDTASIPAGDLLLLAAAAIRDGGAAGIGWAATDVNPGLVGGGNLLLDAYAGKGAGGNAGAGGYLILDGQGVGVRADTVSLPGGDAVKRITAALVVWSTGVTAAAAPSTVAAVAAIPAPTVTTSSNATATPSTVAAVGAVAPPAVQAGAAATPATVAGTAAVPTPDISTGATPVPVVVAVVGAIPAPTVTTTGDAIATPATVAGTATVPEPTAEAGATPTPATGAATAAVPSPTVQAGAAPSTSTVATVGQVGTAQVSAGGTAGPATTTTVAGIPAPALTTTGGATATPATLTCTADIDAAVAQASATVTPTTTSCTATIPAPGVTVSVSATTVTGIAAVPTVTVTTAATITAQTVTAAATVWAVTVQAGAAFPAWGVATSVPATGPSVRVLAPTGPTAAAVPQTIGGGG
jgi:hypothetical protein